MSSPLSHGRCNDRAAPEALLHEGCTRVAVSHCLRDDRGEQGTVSQEDAVVASQSESHYARAKYLVGRKAKPTGLGLRLPRHRDATDQEIAQAQVHATLALVDVMRELLSELVAGRQRDSDTQV